MSGREFGVKCQKKHAFTFRSPCQFSLLLEFDNRGLCFIYSAERDTGSQMPKEHISIDQEKNLL
jgi:hypothetical protein